MASEPREQFQAGLPAYAREIYLYLRRLGADAASAEDLRQETLLLAWQRLARLRDPRKLRSWLYGIAYRVYLSRRDQPARVATEPVEELASRASDPGSDRSLLFHVVRESVLQLPPKYRHALILLYWQELSYREAAAALSLPVGTLAWRAHTGLRLVRRSLREKGVIHESLDAETTADGLTDPLRRP
jgi:RNA polymerase sigma-70 factor (ECF subfamily)